MKVFRRGDARYLGTTNGDTAVAVDVLMLAVSALTREPWDFRFAALVTLQAHNVMGARGGRLRPGGAPLGRHRRSGPPQGLPVARPRSGAVPSRWEKLTHEPPRAEGYSSAYRWMVEQPALGGARWQPHRLDCTYLAISVSRCSFSAGIS